MTSLNNLSSNDPHKQCSRKKCLLTVVSVTVVLIVILGNYQTKITPTQGQVEGNVLLNTSISLLGDTQSDNHSLPSHVESYGTNLLYTSTPHQASTEIIPINSTVIRVVKKVVSYRPKPIKRVVCAQDSKFLVYVYSSMPSTDSAISKVTESLIKDLQLGDSWTDDPAHACIFVVVLGQWSYATSSEEVGAMITSLPHWKEYGNRHVLIELLRSSSNSKLLQQVDTGSALVATSYSILRNASNTHILIPPVLTLQNLRTVIPPTNSLISKKINFVLYFEGEMEGQKSTVDSELFDICKNCPKTSCSFECTSSRERGALENEWSLCNTATDRLEKCKKAMFALVPCGKEGEVGPVTFTRLIEALQCGAVPIVVGDCVNQLPFSDVIEWERAVIFVQPQDLTVTFVFRREEKVRAYMEHGQFLYNTYFSSGLKIVEALVAIIRNQSHHSPMWYRDYIPEMLLNTMPRNLTIAPSNHNQSTQPAWNIPPGPFYAQLYTGYSVAENSQTFSTEKFTIVILTYHRDKSLLHIIGGLRNCPSLDKVVVVWNNEKKYRHPKSLKWPNIGVPIEVHNNNVYTIKITYFHTFSGCKSRYELTK